VGENIGQLVLDALNEKAGKPKSRKKKSNDKKKKAPKPTKKPIAGETEVTPETPG